MWNPVLIPKERDWVIPVSAAIPGAIIAILMAPFGQGVTMAALSCVCLRTAMKQLKCSRRTWDVFLWIGFLLWLAAVLAIRGWREALPMLSEPVYAILTSWFIVLAVFSGFALYRTKRNLEQ